MPNTRRVIIAGSSNHPLAERFAAALGAPLGSRDAARYPDGEIQVELHESVRGCDVYLLQSTAPPVEQHLLELLLLADACRRPIAACLTAVLLYTGYARQERRAHGREAVGARVVADLLQTAGFARVVAVDLHSDALEGFFAMPLEHLSAVPALAEAARPLLPAEAVIVAPDLGAVRRAEHFARLLDRPVAIVHKTRLSGEQVRVGGITGDVRGRAPLIVDDMISTGGTIAAAAVALLAAGCLPEMLVVATHALLVGPAVERLQALPLRRLLTTDSVALSTPVPLPLEVISLAPLLVAAIARLYNASSLRDLVGRP